jgi:hypothetical protein
MFHYDRSPVKQIILVIFFLGVIFSYGFAQLEEPYRLEKPRFFAKSRLGIWFSNFDFTAKTTLESYKIKSGAMANFSPSLRLRLSDLWNIDAGYEFGMGSKTSSHIMELSFGVSVPLEFRFLKPRSSRIGFSTGLLYGIFEAKDLPGKFKNSFGFTAKLLYEKPLGRNFDIEFALEYRYLKFDFKPSAEVWEHDPTIAGAGFSFSAGVNYRF